MGKTEFVSDEQEDVATHLLRLGYVVQCQDNGEIHVFLGNSHSSISNARVYPYEISYTSTFDGEFGTYVVLSPDWDEIDND